MTATSDQPTSMAEPLPDDPSPSGATGSSGSSGSSSSLAVGLLRLARPKQWTKNLLVFAAPGAAGILKEWPALFDACIAFVAFCMAAAGTYYINDARDAEADRLHPKKRYRPIASGLVPVSLGFSLGAALLVGAAGVALLANARTAAVVLAYVCLTTAYSTWLKHIPVIDLVAVASGFVLRAVGGAEATDVAISRWFFAVTIFGSLFVVTGKRGAEAAEMGNDAGAFRPVLAAYRPEYITYLRAVTSGAMLMAYVQWAFDNATSAALANPDGLPWFQASIVPFITAVLRYALVLDQGKGSAPEEIFLSDRILQLTGLAWIVIFGIGVYTA